MTCKSWFGIEHIIATIKILEVHLTKNKKILTSSNYTLLIGNKEGKVSSVDVLKTETYTPEKGKRKKSGIRSIKITTNQKLFDQNFSLSFNSTLKDVEGNESEGKSSWPK